MGVVSAPAFYQIILEPKYYILFANVGHGNLSLLHFLFSSSLSKYVKISHFSVCRSRLMTFLMVFHSLYRNIFYCKYHCRLGKPQKSSSTNGQAIKALTPSPSSLAAIGTFFNSLQQKFLLS